MEIVSYNKKKIRAHLSATVGIRGPLETRGETRCPGGVSVYVANSNLDGYLRAKTAGTWIRCGQTQHGKCPNHGTTVLGTQLHFSQPGFLYCELCYKYISAPNGDLD